MDKEDHYMTLLCYFLNSRDNLVMAIGSTIKTLALDEVMLVLLLEEVRQKYCESTNEALDVCGIYKEKGKKREKGKSKSHGRHKSPGKSKEKCWTCGKVGNFRRDFKEEKKKNKKEFFFYDDESKKYSLKDGEYAFFVALVTRVI